MRWLMTTLASSLLLATSASAHGWLAPAYSPEQYAERATLDLYRQPVRSREVVVLVHGCCGDRRDTAELARALARSGAVVLNPDVRPFGAGGGWPATYVDVVCAVAAARHVADSIGSHLPVTLIGWSDGALVAAAVTLGWESISSDAVRCRWAVPQHGPDRLIGLNGHYGWSGDLSNAPVTAATIAWFDGAPAVVPEHWRRGNPGWWAARAEPSTTPPITLLSVTGDVATAAFASTLRNHAIPVSELDCGAGLHGELIAPRSLAGAHALATMQKLLGLVPFPGGDSAHACT
jgi:hypothetical protein